MYDEEQALKLNEVVEFVGVLSRAPELGTAQDCCGGGGDFSHASDLFADEAAARPPTSQVCCLSAAVSLVQGGQDVDAAVSRICVCTAQQGKLLVQTSGCAIRCVAG